MYYSLYLQSIIKRLKINKIFETKRIWLPKFLFKSTWKRLKPWSKIFNSSNQNMEIFQKFLKECTAQKMNFSNKYVFSKCDQILSKLRIWCYLLKKSLMENLSFCAVITAPFSIVNLGHTSLQIGLKIIASNDIGRRRIASGYYNPGRGIWNGMEKSGKTGQGKESLIYTFACFLAANAVV